MRQSILPLIPAALALLANSSEAQTQATPLSRQILDYPVSGSHAGLPFNTGNLSDAEIALPEHPPLHEIQPIPIPEGSAQGPVSFYRPLTFHDALTNETRDLSGNQPPTGDEESYSVNQEYQGVGKYDPTLENMFGFGSMSATSSHSTYPASANVKLVMKFTDVNGDEVWFNGSGSMGDAGVVVTAAHCVYARTYRDGGGNTIGIHDWADIVYVYPAWDGNGNQWSAPGSGDEMNFWGYAYGSQFLAGSGYINTGDFDSDCGLIRITRGGSRNVGMLTGWYGWTYGASCSTIKSRTHHNWSYPAEQCSSSLHTGRTLYYWLGSFDSCEAIGNEIRINTPGNCLDSVWAGMSGSGAYYIDSSSGTSKRYVQAVCSNGPSNHSYGDYCELWGQFVTDMQAFESSTRTSSEDWEALMFRATGSTSVESGSSLDADCEFQMVNATDANPASRTYTIEVYLSTNNNISTSDTLVGTWNYTLDAGAMANRKFIVPAPTIPSGTPAGTYWLGVVVDASLPGTTSNDDSDTWDAQQITVTDPAPVLESLWADDFESGSLTAGGWNTKNKRVKVSTKAASSGSYGLRLRKKMWAEVSIPTTGYNSCELHIDYRSSKKFEIGEDFSVRWSVGSGWNDLIVSSGDGWATGVTVNLPAGADNNPNFKLRFKASGDAANEWGDVDNLNLMGWK